MPYYRQVGEVPRKRHTHGGADALRRHEELMGRNGFSSSSALLYHLHSPSALLSATAVRHDRVEAPPDLPLVPRHLRTDRLSADSDPVLGRRLLFANTDVAVSWTAATRSSGLYRNAMADELVFVQAGTAHLETSFGALEVVAGDYVVVPRSTIHRWVIDGPLAALVVEARSGQVGIPSRYLSEGGQLLEGSPFSERDLRGPEQPLVVEGQGVDVLVRHAGGLTTHCHARHPFDVVGWDGHLWPYAMSIHDFEPIVGAIHQPPPVHQTFEAPGFVVCSFVPRLYDFHPDAVKVPYHHANVDSDELLFYADGDFMSRAGSGVGVGSISFHPAGFVHGPQPGSLERSLTADATGEVAVMIDTFRPLGVTDDARAVSDEAYLDSWLTPMEGT